MKNPTNPAFNAAELHAAEKLPVGKVITGDNVNEVLSPDIIGRITDAFVAFDKNWNYTFINKKASQLNGRLPHELLGKNIWTEFPEKKEQYLYKQFLNAFRQQRKISVEGYYPPWNIWFHAILYPSPNGLSVFLQDITQRRKGEAKMQESETIYRQIVETAQEGIWMIDENGRTTFVNRKMGEILEYTADEMIGKESRFFMDDSSKKMASKALARRKKGVVENIHLRFQTKSGKLIWANLSANPIVDNKGKYKGALAMVTDITEKTVLQQQLLNEQLNKQKEITKAVENAQEKERSEIGQELHDNVHQLLATSKLYLKHSLSKAKNNNTYIQKSLDYLGTAMEELRKLSHALVGPANENTLSFLDAIKELIDVNSIVHDIKINFTCIGFNEDDIAPGLKLVTYRIIQEQMSNILKYAFATEINLELKIENDQFIIIIKDNGKGFDTNAPRKGIGLKNIKNRVGVYNGKVSIISSPGNGVKMEIIFKLSS